MDFEKKFRQILKVNQVMLERVIERGIDDTFWNLFKIWYPFYKKQEDSQMLVAQETLFYEKYADETLRVKVSVFGVLTFPDLLWTWAFSPQFLINLNFESNKNLTIHNLDFIE